MIFNGIEWHDNRCSQSRILSVWCGSMLPHHHITYNDVIFTESELKYNFS